MLIIASALPLPRDISKTKTTLSFSSDIRITSAEALSPSASSLPHCCTIVSIFVHDISCFRFDFFFFLNLKFFLYCRIFDFDLNFLLSTTKPACSYNPPTSFSSSFFFYFSSRCRFFSFKLDIS